MSIVIPVVVVAAVIHLSGAVQAIAPAIGAVGTILSTADSVVADVTGVRKYIAEKKALHAAQKLHPVTIPKKAATK